jgi:ABC-type branched-subunit amino acid transport system permease subunit
LLTVAAAALLALVPATGANSYTLHVLSLVGVYAIVAMGLNLVFGYTGQISLGHAAYFAVGAYASALITMHLGVPFPVGLAAGVLAAVALGFLVGVPSLKLEGSYLAMATIGFGEIVKMLLVNWEDVTGGPAGISRIPHPDLVVLTISGASLKFYLVLGIVLVTFVLYLNLVRSHYGSRFVAVRDSPRAAAAMGIDVARTKLYAFVFSTAYAGLAGSLYAHLNRYIAPDAFTLGESINFLIIVVVGGMGTLLGPLIGAAIIVYLRETLLAFKDFNMLIYGLLLMALMVFMPRGLVGTVGSLAARWRVRMPWQKSDMPSPRAIEKAVE